MNENINFSNFIGLVALMGRPEFESTFLAYLAEWIDAKHFSILRVKNSKPSLLLCGTHNDHHNVPFHCGQSYVQRFHVYDDLYQNLATQELKQNQTLTGQVCADDIIFSPYRREIYEQNDLIQRLCGFYRDENNHPILFNLYRHKEQGFYSDLELANFEQMIPALSKLIQGHLALQIQPDFKIQLLKRQPLLTPQEVEVCALILKGLSYAGIAAAMALKESTIKTYRNRAFDKLGINFKNQLFAMFMQA
ncbi:helix-turn-helix transcriptional regulator [Acinetobacter tianfuensis]|uniref:LuxR family transcriptional regulator n=1 Tax=Acinetobacter tianfuensis TaxID=2419603 RepID=A0A3A8E6C8_9GAMM|nr:LuxR C-terminal-related transcriptional regulator [Acinetobacter tianfuensis]RKG30622.1 LuxR family transcriptional regulator [Acinetobacter tianfuensis]